ncbi:MAG: Hsp20/alpha crystallin family protein [Usitatibacter sp.]
MFRRTGSTDWMWAHACDLMDQAERMHRQFFRLATSSRAQAAWEPPADVFEDEREVVIVIAMPGVSAERIEVASEPGELVVRGERALPFARSRYAVRNLEIPYGHFERRIALPEGRFESVTHELSHGCLILRLRK